MVQRGQKRRAEETEEQRNSRLSDMAQRGQERKAEETEEQRNSRLSDMTQRSQESRSKQKNKEITDWTDKACHVTSVKDALFEIARATPGHICVPFSKDKLSIHSVAVLLKHILRTSFPESDDTFCKTLPHPSWQCSPACSAACDRFVYSLGLGVVLTSGVMSGFKPSDSDLIPKVKEPIRGIYYRTVPEYLKRQTSLFEVST
ncbi:hypothetical protein AVEN_33100-1 [Araneus ventricosus]|uniref:STPR domain-containing protein n=1 Tax=Araneus ventricosus TaxID=182803 RepID=A0A4Y2CVS2_ARAVE|nr:hypothetical protein AVEN_33100-1 [Araneus ventricosus]